jgi:hypothetical protein
MTVELYRLQKQLLAFLGRYHAVMFIASVSLILAYATFLLYQVVQTTSVQPDITKSSIAGFNQKTIDKIKNLHDSSATSSTVTLPSPRSNPFSE